MFAKLFYIILYFAPIHTYIYIQLALLRATNLLIIIALIIITTITIIIITITIIITTITIIIIIAKGEGRSNDRRDTHSIRAFQIYSAVSAAHFST